MHLVVVSLFRLGLQSQQMHLHQPGRRRIIAITQCRQSLEPLTALILPSDLRQSRTDLLSNSIWASSSTEDNSRPGRSAWRTTAPLHDRRHRAAHAAGFAIVPKLLAPVLQQYFHCLDHRPSPRKTEPDTKNARPKTNPTQINLFKINTFINSELSVLGLLGLSVLAYEKITAFVCHSNNVMHARTRRQTQHTPHNRRKPA
ncbi:hypothetical protein D3C86_1594450 [compost metagenome]